MAMSRSLGSMSLTSVSPMNISPELIDSRPAIMRSTVDLPQPEEPTSTANSRSWISIERSSTAVTALNRFTRFFRITLATLDVSFLVRRCFAVDLYIEYEENPPSIGTTTPVTKLEASDSNQTRAPIRSSAVPERPMDVWAITLTARANSL